MPKILITGNGFDLNLGLPTAYSDFISILKYVIDGNDLDFQSIYQMSCNKDKIYTNYKPFKINSQNIPKIKELTSKNLWFDFFRDEYEIETWIDFENKIEYVLKILFSSIDYIKENIFAKGSQSIHNNQLIYNLKLFNNNIEIIQVLIKFKIINSLNDGYNFILNKDFLKTKYSSYIDIDIDKITQFFYNALIEFKVIFNYYFETFVYPFYDNLKVKIDRNLFAKINKHYTFNYTPTFEKIYGNNRITKFLHGTINSELNKIVIGISEIPENRLADQRYFLPFTKYFQKLNNNTDYVFIKEYETKTSDNFLFFFWGHSLDKSDEDYLNEVFDFVNKLNAKTKKIVVIYHEESSKSKLLLNILNIRGKIDIQNLMRAKILEFIHIDAPELQRELNREVERTPIRIR